MYQIRSIVILFFLGVTGVVLGQTNPTELSLTILDGESATFTLHSDWGVEPNTSFAPSHGIVVVMPRGNDDYEVTYIPSGGYFGNDVFSIQSLISSGGGFSFPTPELTVVYIEVIRSVVSASDDFVDILSDDPLEIFPLTNDESNTSSHTLKAVSQVMYGVATMTDSNSVMYTPSSENLDFIVYSIQDSVGTTSLATIYLKREEELQDSTYASFTISSTQNQYLFLASDDFIAQSTFEFGKITAVTSKVVKYTPYDDTEGSEHLIFETSQGELAVFDIDIYKTDVDDGVVRDDYVYTSIDHEIVFNVLANDFDNSLVIDEENTSDELFYLGGGSFSYIPPAGYIGLKEFSYTATNGFSTETGSISIAIHNFEPQATATYEFDMKEGGVLSLPYEVPIEDFYFEIASDPVYGTLGYYSDDEIVSTTCGDIVNRNVVVYTPFDGYEGMDEFELLYCPDDGVNPCQLIKTRVDIYTNEEADCNCVDDCVWSGDANNDGQVDMLDVLTIGRSMGASGSIRDGGSDWTGESVDDWTGNTIYGVNHKYADTDGDGDITSADVDVVIDNYSAVHSYTQQNILAVKNYPFYLIPQSTNVQVGDHMIIDIIMGSEDYPVVDLQGVAFAINLSSVVVDSSSVKLTFLKDEYFVNQSPFLDVMHQPRDGIIYAGGIKSNRTTSNGYGIIAQLDFIVEDEVEGLKTPQKMRSLSGKSYFDLDVLIDDIVIEDGRGYQFAISPASTHIEVELQDDDTETIYPTTRVYPNPVSDVLTVSLNDGDNLVQLLDMMGRTVVSRTVSDEVDHTTLDVSRLTLGTYLLHITSDTETFTQKVQVLR